jgi:DNA ligase-1
MMKMKPTPFAALAASFEQLERTSASSRITHLLADLFAQLSPRQARLAGYLLRGQVGPDYEGADLGMAEKLVRRAGRREWLPCGQGQCRLPQDG